MFYSQTVLLGHSVINNFFVPPTMSTGKETIKEDPKSDAPREMCQRKLPKAAGKRRILCPEPSPVKQIKMPECKAPSVEHCAFCSKKLKFLTMYACRCEKVFCSRHRFFDQHQCAFDFKKEAQNKLRESNPKIQPKKLGE